MVYLAILWLLLWTAGQRRWRLWWGLGGGLAALIVIPMVPPFGEPSWIPDFIRQSLAYPSYTVYGSLTWMIVHYWLGLGRGVEIAVLVILVGATAALGWHLWRGSWEQMVWMLGVLLLLTNLFHAQDRDHQLCTPCALGVVGFPLDAARLEASRHVDSGGHPGHLDGRLVAVVPADNRG